MRLLFALFCIASLAAPCAAASRHIIVIAMENKDASNHASGHEFIYGNKNAPYINGELSAQAARANNFVDDTDAHLSQPHYIQMLAGRTVFHDADFTCDQDPLEPCSDSNKHQNWTTSSGHLMAQLDAALDPTLTWMTYQEGYDPEKTGACPIYSDGLYAAKHNPFVYFADVSGDPPSTDNGYCIAHTRELGQFETDMNAGTLANFVFITPDLCNDMHGAPSCPTKTVARGDQFLKSFLPPIISWAKKNDAIIFVTWDESSGSRTMPFFVAGAGVKAGYVSDVKYSHSSELRTIERIFGLPVLDAVKHAVDLSDMFDPGVLPDS